MITLKQLKFKGNLATFAGLISVAGYVAYFVTYYSANYRLDEVYFMNNCFTTSVFTYLCFGFFKHRFVRTVLLFTSIFHAMLLLTYIGNWLILGNPYAWIKFALIAGFLIGLIYYWYDTATNST